MSPRCFYMVIIAAILFAGFTQQGAEARGRSRGSSPFVVTPYGIYPKSVYYAPYMDAASLARFRAAEEAYMKKMQGKNGGTTTKKPSSTTKKK